MYSEDEIVRIKSIHTKLTSIYAIIKRHGSIVETLHDIEGQPAILMLLVAMAEQFSKLHKQNAKVLNEFDKEDIKGLISVRNYLAHDYDGVNLGIIEDDLRFNMPKIFTILDNILQKS